MNQSTNTTIHGIAEQGIDLQEYVLGKPLGDDVLKYEVSYNTAINSRVARYIIEAVNKSGVLNAPKIVSQTAAPKFENGYTTTLKNLKPNLQLDQLSDRAKNIAKLQASLPTRDTNLFEGAWRIASHTGEQCDFEKIIDKTHGIIESTKRVGLQKAVQELPSQYAISNKAESEIKYHIAIFETMKKQNISIA